MSVYGQSTDTQTPRQNIGDEPEFSTSRPAHSTQKKEYGIRDEEQLLLQ